MCFHRGVRDAARPAGAGRSCDAGVLLSAPFLPVGSRAEGGHAGGRCPDAWKTGRQTHPSRLPTDDHQTRKRNDRHYHLANITHTHTLLRALSQRHPMISSQRIVKLIISGLSDISRETQTLIIRGHMFSCSTLPFDSWCHISKKSQISIQGQ